MPVEFVSRAHAPRPAEVTLIVLVTEPAETMADAVKAIPAKRIRTVIQGACAKLKSVRTAVAPNVHVQALRSVLQQPAGAKRAISVITTTIALRSEFAKTEHAASAASTKMTVRVPESVPQTDTVLSLQSALLLLTVTRVESVKTQRVDPPAQHVPATASFNVMFKRVSAKNQRHVPTTINAPVTEFVSPANAVSPAPTTSNVPESASVPIRAGV